MVCLASIHAIICARLVSAEEITLCVVCNIPNQPMNLQLKAFIDNADVMLYKKVT